MDNQTEWTLNVNRQHLEQLMHDADTHRQLQNAYGNWKYQLAQTLQTWARKLEPELEQPRHKLA